MIKISNFFFWLKSYEDINSFYGLFQKIVLTTIIIRWGIFCALILISTITKNFQMWKYLQSDLGFNTYIKFLMTFSFLLFFVFLRNLDTPAFSQNIADFQCWLADTKRTEEDYDCSVKMSTFTKDSKRLCYCSALRPRCTAIAKEKNYNCQAGYLHKLEDKSVCGTRDCEEKDYQASCCKLSNQLFLSAKNPITSLLYLLPLSIKLCENFHFPCFWYWGVISPSICFYLKITNKIMELIPPSLTEMSNVFFFLQEIEEKFPSASCRSLLLVVYVSNCPLHINIYCNISTERARGVGGGACFGASWLFQKLKWAWCKNGIEMGLLNNFPTKMVFSDFHCKRLCKNSLKIGLHLKTDFEVARYSSDLHLQI